MKSFGSLPKLPSRSSGNRAASVSESGGSRKDRSKEKDKDKASSQETYATRRSGMLFSMSSAGSLGDALQQPRDRVANASTRDVFDYMDDGTSSEDETSLMFQVDAGGNLKRIVSLEEIGVRPPHALSRDASHAAGAGPSGNGMMSSPNKEKITDIVPQITGITGSPRERRKESKLAGFQNLKDTGMGPQSTLETPKRTNAVTFVNNNDVDKIPPSQDPDACIVVSEDLAGPDIVSRKHSIVDEHQHSPRLMKILTRKSPREKDSSPEGDDGTETHDDSGFPSSRMSKLASMQFGPIKSSESTTAGSAQPLRRKIKTAFLSVSETLESGSASEGVASEEEEQILGSSKDHVAYVKLDVIRAKEVDNLFSATIWMMIIAVVVAVVEVILGNVPLLVVSDVPVYQNGQIVDRKNVRVAVMAPYDKLAQDLGVIVPIMWYTNQSLYIIGFLVMMFFTIVFGVRIFRLSSERRIYVQYWSFLQLFAGSCFINPYAAIEGIIDGINDNDNAVVPDNLASKIFNSIFEIFFQIALLLYPWAVAHTFRLSRERRSIAYKVWVPKLLLLSVLIALKIVGVWIFELSLSSMPFISFVSMLFLYGSSNFWITKICVYVAAVTSVEIIVALMIVRQFVATSRYLQSLDYLRTRPAQVGFRFFRFHTVYFFVQFYCSYAVLIFGWPLGYDQRNLYGQSHFTTLSVSAPTVSLVLSVLGYFIIQAYGHLPSEALGFKGWFKDTRKEAIGDSASEISSPTSLDKYESSAGSQFTYRLKERYRNSLPISKPNCFVMQTAVSCFNFAWLSYSYHKYDFSDRMRELGFSIYEEIVDQKTDTHAIVIVMTDRFLVTFRGTSSSRNIQTDVAIHQRQIASVLNISEDLQHKLAGRSLHKAKVHSGFADAYERIRERLLEALEHVLSSDKRGPYKRTVFCTGHSMGGALATLCALDCALYFSLPFNRVSVFAFGTPRVGNQYFATIYNEFVGYHWRVNLLDDLIPNLPRIGYSENVGKKCVFNERGYLFLDPTGLEVKRHGIWSTKGLAWHKKSSYMLLMLAWCHLHHGESYHPEFWAWPLKNSIMIQHDPIIAVDISAYEAFKHVVWLLREDRRQGFMKPRWQTVDHAVVENRDLYDTRGNEPRSSSREDSFAVGDGNDVPSSRKGKVLKRRSDAQGIVPLRGGSDSETSRPATRNTSRDDAANVSDVESPAPSSQKGAFDVGRNSEIHEKSRALQAMSGDHITQTAAPAVDANDNTDNVGAYDIEPHTPSRQKIGALRSSSDLQDRNEMTPYVAKSIDDSRNGARSPSREQGMAFSSVVDSPPASRRMVGLLKRMSDIRDGDILLRGSRNASRDDGVNAEGGDAPSSRKGAIFARISDVPESMDKAVRNSSGDNIPNDSSLKSMTDDISGVEPVKSPSGRGNEIQDFLKNSLALISSEIDGDQPPSFKPVRKRSNPEAVALTPVLWTMAPGYTKGQRWELLLRRLMLKKRRLELSNINNSNSPDSRVMSPTSKGIKASDAQAPSRNAWIKSARLDSARLVSEDRTET